MTRYLFLLLLGGALAFGNIACAPKRVGPTPAGYLVSWEVDSFGGGTRVGTPVPLLVHVRNAQGGPADGVPVEFEVAPNWQGSASITPQQMVTRGGRARATFVPETTGVARVLVRVDQTVQEAAITVSPRLGVGTGGRN